MSEIKEFSELNGYGVKDAVARADIERLKNAGGGKLYKHDIKCYTPDSYGIVFTIYNSSPVEYTAQTSLNTNGVMAAIVYDDATGEYFPVILTKIEDYGDKIKFTMYSTASELLRDVTVFKTDMILTDAVTEV